MESVMRYKPESFLTDGFGCRYAWLDLVNSEHLDGFSNRTDHLLQDGWIQAFLARWSFNRTLVKSGPGNDTTALRATLRRTAQAVARSEALDKSDLAALNAVLAEPLVRQLTGRGSGSYEFVPRPLDLSWRWVHAQVAGSFAQMLVDEPAKRVKICPNQGCTWVFFDETKGNTRRWCNDLTCGNRDKVRRFRERQKE
jgi:predicted RNA-binding Zn ribbon-like protein